MFNKIFELCKKNEITIAELERNLGFGACTIRKWKNSSPSVDKLKQVADYFGVTINFFLEEQVN